MNSRKLERNEKKKRWGDYMKKQPVYIMFDPDETEINLDISHNKLKKFEKMWNEGYSIGEIAYKLQCKQVEVELLAIDRFIRGGIQPRKGHMQGTKPWLKNENKIKITMEG